MEAFLKSIDEAHEQGKVFNAPNWCKSGKTIITLREAVRSSLKAYTSDSKKVLAELREKLKMPKRDFEAVWKSE